MYTEQEKTNFSLAAESLKKYRRAEIIGNDGSNLMKEMYVDLLPNNAVLEKCKRDNTTYLVGRKGTGKSTIFLMLENEYRNKKHYLPCYLDVKTIFEQSQAQVANQSYLSEYFDNINLEKYLLSRNFIKAVLNRIYSEIDKKHKSLWDMFKGSNSATKQKISDLIERIENGEHLKQVEIPALKQHKNTRGIQNKEANSNKIGSSIGLRGTIPSISASGELGHTSESDSSFEDEYLSVFIQVFDVNKIVCDLKDILKEMSISRLIVMLDDVSEVDEVPLRMFIDSIVAPLNNWSEEFIKFKVAFYPNRVHYGSIDPGKIDRIDLDFYNLYSTFDTNKMEENATDFTKRLVDNRFNYYVGKRCNYFVDSNMSEEDLYNLLFRVSMNVPRILGYILSYLYESTIIYDKTITRTDIENAAVRYYDDNIDAYFRNSTYCLLSLEEKNSISKLIRIRDAIVNQSKAIKTQISRGDLSGSIYKKNMPYSSHFHVQQDLEKYLESLELNHFITKYEEKSNKDGVKVSVYCINYGLAKRNNIVWGRERGADFRKYFIERPFNYSKIILEQIKEEKDIRCSNPLCNRKFSEEDMPGLTFNNFKCPDCMQPVNINIICNNDVTNELKQNEQLELVKTDEMSIIMELAKAKEAVSAREMSELIDVSSRRIAKICKRLDEKKGIVHRTKSKNIFLYSLTKFGKKYYKK